MVVPTVLAIIARRNCARCSASGNGLAVMSNVVILPLLGPYQTRGLRNAFRCPSTEVDEGIDVCVLVSWGGADTAQSRRCRRQEAGPGWRAAGIERDDGNGLP